MKRICAKILEILVLDALLVVDHHSDLKSSCSPSRFREIAIANLARDGGSTNFIILERPAPDAGGTETPARSAER